MRPPSIVWSTSQRYKKTHSRSTAAESVARRANCRRLYTYFSICQLSVTTSAGGQLSSDNSMRICGAQNNILGWAPAVLRWKWVARVLNSPVVIMYDNYMVMISYGEIQRAAYNFASPVFAERR